MCVNSAKGIAVCCAWLELEAWMRLYLIVQAALQQSPPVWIRAASNCRDRKRDRRAEYKTITYFPHCKNNLFAFFNISGKSESFIFFFGIFIFLRTYSFFLTEHTRDLLFIVVSRPQGLSYFVWKSSILNYILWFYFVIASCTATATATVAPTIGLLPSKSWHFGLFTYSCF